MTNLTYRQLQQELKHYRDECGIPVRCKLNAKKEILQKEYESILFAEWNMSHPDDPITEPLNINSVEEKNLNCVESMFDYKLTNGDLLGAINHSLVECDQSSKIAQEAIAEIEGFKTRMDKRAKDVLAKYQPL